MFFIEKKKNHTINIKYLYYEPHCKCLEEYGALFFSFLF